MESSSPSPSLAKPRGMRHHTKSRSGCIDCKTRRVKCDERKPACSACERRQTPCRYVAPDKRSRPGDDLVRKARQNGAQPDTHPVAAGSPRGADDSRLLASPGTDREVASPSLLCNYTRQEMLRLRLLHHFTSSTVTSFTKAFQLGGVTSTTLQVDVPKLAFHHHFLMDAILSVALLHMASTEPALAADLPVAQYWNQALSGLREQVACFSQGNARAVVTTSVLLAIAALAADRLSGYEGIWLTNWLALTIGPRVILPARGAMNPSRGGERDMGGWDAAFGHWSPVAVPPELEEAVRFTGEDDEDWDHRDDIRLAVQGIGRLFGALACPSCGLSSPSCVEFKVRAWPFVFVTSGFVNLARQERPRALVIMSYYLAFFHWFPRIWVYEGVASRDMEKIASVVGPEWVGYLSAPRVAVLVKDTNLLTRFLIGLVPVGHINDKDSHQRFLSLEE